MSRTPWLQHLALAAIWPVSILYLGASSLAYAQSGDAPVAGFIVDETNALFGETDDVIVTTACLEGNPVNSTPTLSGCKLDIPAGTGTNGADTGQLILVLPNNYDDDDVLGDDVLTSVRTFSSGSNTRIESDVTVEAVSKDIFLGLATPAGSTADIFCTSIDSRFVCARIGFGSGSASSCPAGEGLLNIVSDADATDFCSALEGLLEGAYDLERHPLAYAVSTTMRDLGDDESRLATPGSVTLRLCPGLQAQCLSPAGSPVLSGVSTNSMHTQASFVETPRLRCCAFP